MESYKIIAAPRIYKDLKKFPKDVVLAVTMAIDGLVHNPRPSNCKKLRGSHQDEYRLRVKDYRILYEIFDKEKTVRILRILGRKEAYR